MTPKAMQEAIYAEMGRHDRLVRADVARQLGTTDADLTFRQAWNDARNAWAPKGRDIGPSGEGDGVYEVKAPRQTQRRSAQDRSAALRKLERAAAKVEGVDMKQVPAEERDGMRRAQEKSRTMVAVVGSLSRRRKFDFSADTYTRPQRPARQTRGRSKFLPPAPTAK